MSGGEGGTVPGGPLRPGAGAPVAAAAVCQDCGAPVSGNYCSNCGQETKIETPTVRQFTHELMDQYIAVEGKLGRTLRVLVTRPGQLTVDYVEGRRQRYVRPLKLYVSISVVFFGLLGILPDSIGNPFTSSAPAAAPQAPPPETATPVPPAAGIAPPPASTVPTPAAPATPGVPAAEQADMDEDLRQQIHKEIEADVKNGQEGAIADSVRRSVDAAAQKHVKARKKGLDALSSPEQRKELRAKLADDAPYAMFFLLPYFALLLRWLYRKNQFRYGVHLLFSVHLHCFAFILLALMFVPLSPLRTALELGGGLYLFLALRRVYGGGWKGTLWRMALLAFFDFVAVSATTLSGVMSIVFGSA